MTASDEFADGPMRAVPVFDDHSIRESHDEVAAQCEFEILLPVNLELISRMERPSVEFDDESVAHEEVDPTNSSEVHLRADGNSHPMEEQTCDRLQPGVAVSHGLIDRA